MQFIIIVFPYCTVPTLYSVSSDFLRLLNVQHLTQVFIGNIPFRVNKETVSHKSITITVRPQWHPQQKDDKRLGDKGATEPQLPHQGPEWTAEDHLTRNKKETAHPK